jgi:ribonuclease HI
MATTLTLRGPQGELATSISEKEVLIREIAFPPAPRDSEAIEISQGNWHTQVNGDTVRRALFHQAVQKAPGTDRLNFRALRLLWEWDSPRIVALARQCFRLGVHPRAWKTAKGILLRKPNKPDYTLVKAYRVISLLNCLGKVVEKIAAEAIADHCETTGGLHLGQMGNRKQRSAIDAVACLIQSTHEAWKRKQLMGALFIDVKGAFDHVNPRRLVIRMRELSLDGDLIRWVQSFLTDRQVQLSIDNTQCPAHTINSGVPQGSPASPILFIIYLSGVFDIIERAVPEVQALSFADDVGLLAPGYSVQETCIKLQEAAKVAIEWGRSNEVQFEAEKTEAVLFTRKRGRELQDQTRRARIMVEGHQVQFNHEATRWLGIWLDAGLTLKTHYQTRLRKARNAEAQVKSLCRAHGLAPGLVRRVQLAVVQSAALYGAELWWRGQKDRLAGIQLMINRQSRAITGMLKTTPIGPLVREAGLSPAEALLEDRQLGYTTRLLSLPDDHSAKMVLPASFREGDQHVQPGEQTPGNRMWARADSRGPWSLGQHLARQLASVLPADPSGGFESLRQASKSQFPGQIKVWSTEEAQAAAQTIQPGQALWSDGSRLENGRSGAGVAWQDFQGSWKTRGFPLGLGQEVFDAELLGALQALRIAKRVRGKGPITILLDSQAAIARLQHTQAGPGQALAIQAHAAARDLLAQGREPIIQWVPGHTGIEGNERADQAAKQAASKPGSGLKGLSLAFTSRVCTEAVQARKKGWLARALTKRSKQSQLEYRPQKGWQLDPVAAQASKQLASRYYQLKTGHAAIGTYLHQIQARDSPACQGCGEPKETVHHLFFECREWRHQRAKLYSALERDGIARPSAAEDYPEGRLLGEPKATKAILQFLATTRVALSPGHLQRAVEQARQDDEWGLEALEDADRTGEG